MELMLTKDLIADVSADRLRQALTDLPEEDGEIVQLGPTRQRYIHTMVMEDGSGRIGFYLEKRGPNPDQWHAGEPRDFRPKSRLTRPWWQFWGSDFETYLFSRDEMISVIMDYFSGVESPQQVRWTAIKPSYED